MNKPVEEISGNRRWIKLVENTTEASVEYRKASESGSDESDGDLVISAREGDRMAQEALFRRHVGWVDSLAYRLAPRDADADDIVQESFAAALESMHKLREPEAFRGWLRTIVVRSAKRLFRRKKLRVRLGLDSFYPLDIDRVVSPAAPPDVRAELCGIYGLLESLSPDVRIALVLRKVEGWKIQEIAEWTGMSEGTVKRKVRKGEKRLAESLGTGRIS